MLLAAMCFWYIFTNTFKLPCGIVTPILFDIFVNASLWPSEEDYEPFIKIGFNFSSHVYSTFIGHHRDFGGVIDAHEDIAFFIY